MNYRTTFFALIASVALVGCSTSKPSRFYSLSATASPGAGTTNVAVLVGPVTIPAAVDRPQFVVQVADNRVEVDEFNRWDSAARRQRGARDRGRSLDSAWHA